MSEDTEFPIIEDVLKDAMRKELRAEETLLWSGYPDTDLMAWTVIIFPLCWLSGIFLYTVSMVRNEAGDSGEIISGMIFLIVIIGFMGMMEAIAVPFQAKRTIYAITNLRTFALRLRGRFGPQGVDDDGIFNRKLIRQEKDTIFFYFAYTLPIHIIFLCLIVNFMMNFRHSFDFFILGSFGVIILGWLYQWHQDMRYPLPKFREYPRKFYVIDEWLATVETITHEKLDKAVLHMLPAGNGDIFLVSKDKGCLRMKSVPEARKVYSKLGEQKTGQSEPVEVIEKQPNDE